MKKIKKILIPLLMIMCIPLFLAGCSSPQGFIKFSKENDQAWYYVTPDKKVKNVFIIKNDKLTTTDGMDTQPMNNIFASNNENVLTNVTKICNSETSQAVKEFEKDSSDPDVHGAEIEKGLSYSYKVNNDKSETINYGNDSSFTLTKPNTKIKINGKTYTGYKYKDNNDASNAGYLVTNTNHKLGFDKANN